LSPTSAATRALAILEQFLGVSYVVVVVARLVSLTTSASPESTIRRFMLILK